MDQQNYLRDAFKFHWKIVLPDIEYPFSAEELAVPGRHYRFDDVLHLENGTAVAIEFDGDCHRNKDKWERDHEKMAIAASMGVLVVPLTYKMLENDPHRWVRLVWSMIE